jgi:RecB family exonuclease
VVAAQTVRPRIPVVDAYDPVSRKLARQAPIAERDLPAALARYEGLTILQLEEAFRENERRFKEWVMEPANAGRSIQEFPGYVDRIAIDSLIERRTWME